MKKSTNTNNKEKGIFTVEFPLITEPYQEDILAKRMEMARRVYNQTLRITLDRYEKAMSTEPALSIKSELKEINKEKYEKINQKKKEAEEKGEAIDEKALEKEIEKIRKSKTPREKELYTELNQIYFNLGISKFGIPTLMQTVMKNAGYNKPHGPKGKRYKNLDTTIAASLGDNLYAAWQKKLFGNGENIHFHRYGTINTLCGKNNKTGPRVILNHTSKHWEGAKTAVAYTGLEIPIQISDNIYETVCFEHEIAYNRIVRRRINGKDRYFVQILFRGLPPAKINPETGEFLHSIGKGPVAIAVSSDNIAVISNAGFELLSLAPSHKDNSEQIAKLHRKMNASRRATNPHKFNEDGTIKRGVKARWISSRRYLNTKEKVAELQRKDAVNRKIDHYKLANYILSLGDSFYISKTSFKEKQQRTKDSFVKIPKSTLELIPLGDTAPNNAIKVILNEKSTSSYGNVIVPEKMFLAAKKKFCPLHIVMDDAEYIVSEIVIAEHSGAHTHANEGATIKDRAPAMMVELLSQKVNAYGGKLTKATSTNLCMEVIKECGLDESAKTLQAKLDVQVEETCHKTGEFIASTSDYQKNMIREAYKIAHWASKLYVLDQKAAEKAAE